MVPKKSNYDSGFGSGSGSVYLKITVVIPILVLENDEYIPTLYGSGSGSKKMTVLSDSSSRFGSDPWKNYTKPSSNNIKIRVYKTLMEPKRTVFFFIN